MSSLPNPPFVTPEQYLEMDRAAEHRSEYADGVIYAMSGGTWDHNQITLNAYRSLAAQVEGRGCRVGVVDVRIAVRRKGPYLYPDLAVICGRAEFEEDRKDILLNPKVVIEVLSPSTASYDRGKKFEMYREIKSLTEYLLIAQECVYVEHYVLQSSGRWEFSEMKDPGGTIELPTIGATLKASDLCRAIEWQ